MSDASKNVDVMNVLECTTMKLDMLLLWIQLVTGDGHIQLFLTLDT